jgi:hypothetical protein
MHDADIFVFYDDVQFTKNDWRNRNKLKGPNGCCWASIPTGTDLNRLICEVSPSNRLWQTKHWKTITNFYGKTPYFQKYREFFEDFYLDQRWDNLSVLNQHLIKHIARDFLGIRTRLLNSAELSKEGLRQEKLLQMLAALDSRTYISGPAAMAYIEPEVFRHRGIELVWKDYSGYPEYKQSYPPFQHEVSILDLLFQTGPDAPYFIWGWREKLRSPVACR